MKMIQSRDGRSCITTGDATTCLMCPKCYAYVLLEVECSIKGSISSGEDLLIRPAYRLDCPDCRARSSFIEIDTGVAEAVKQLNRKGYTTTMCCHGHLTDSKPRMFVKFSKSVDGWFSSFPMGWQRNGLFLEYHFSSASEQLVAWKQLTDWALLIQTKGGD